MAAGLAGITASVVEYALDGLSQRHNAIASNIANINTAGYRPVEVKFEDKIAEILASQNKSRAVESKSSVLPPQITYMAPLNGSVRKVNLDTSAVMLNQNALQYQALLKGLDKYVSSIAIAINEGRR